jgi:hypothetical protein
MQPDLALRALAAALIDSFSEPQSSWLRAGAVAAETTAKLIPLGTHPLRGIASPCAVSTVADS